MSKTPTDPEGDLQRIALNGPTMGTRWSALFYAPQGFDPAPLQVALQEAVDQIDAQMSLWKADSDLVRLNAAPEGVWVDLPAHLMRVLGLGLRIGRASDGAFDIGMGDAVAAWGFGPDPASNDAILAARQVTRRPAHEVLELDPQQGRARKSAPLRIDLNGIAKGYGTDRLSEVLRAHRITGSLTGIDGEMVATGLRPDAGPWTIAVEAPDPDRRTPHAMLALHDGAVATSGDYRHWVEVQGRRLSHTMAPDRGMPLTGGPASVTVIAPSCAEADAWATALMVKGAAAGALMARRAGLSALFLTRGDGGVAATGIGPVFETGDPLPIS